MPHKELVYTRAGTERASWKKLPIPQTLELLCLHETVGTCRIKKTQKLNIGKLGQPLLTGLIYLGAAETESLDILDLVLSTDASDFYTELCKCRALEFRQRCVVSVQKMHCQLFPRSVPPARCYEYFTLSCTQSTGFPYTDGCSATERLLL